MLHLTLELFLYVLIEKLGAAWDKQKIRFHQITPFFQVENTDFSVLCGGQHVASFDIKNAVNLSGASAIKQNILS